MRKSQIGYDGDHYAWNPGGCGCSGGCDYCWARGCGKRMQCEQCKNFEVHLHAKRLDEPAKRKKPCFVLVNFTCDTFDKKRSEFDMGAIIAAAGLADHHTYIWLTKNPGRLAKVMGYFHDVTPPNWYLGLTLTNDDDARQKLDRFRQIPGKKWISYEPAHTSLNWACSTIEGEWEGVIVGHDNRRGAPGTRAESFDYIRRTVRECVESGIRIYIKQLWLYQCVDCGKPMGPVNGVPKQCECGCGKAKAKLVTNPEHYPECARHRQLPWAKEKQG